MDDLARIKEDRALLLRWVLQNQQQSQKIILPENMSHDAISSSALDAINVKELLNSVSTGVPFDLRPTLQYFKKPLPPPPPVNLNLSSSTSSVSTSPSTSSAPIDITPSSNVSGGPPPIPQRPPSLRVDIPPHVVVTSTGELLQENPIIMENSLEVSRSPPSSPTFSEMHSRFGDSPSLPKLPPQWTFQPNQLQLLAYESLLLCTVLVGSNELSEKESEVLLDIIRPQLNVSSKKHSVVLSMLKTPKKESNLSSVNYRVTLLSSKKASDVTQMTSKMTSEKDSTDEKQLEEFKEWKERQCAAIFNGFSHLLTKNKSTIEDLTLNGRTASIIEFLESLKTLLEDIMKSDDNPSISQLDDLNEHVKSVSSTLTLDYLPFVYPLTIQLYEALLKASFDFEDGILLDSGERSWINQVLSFYRIQHDISNFQHELCFIRVCFEQYKVFDESHNLLDTIKDHLMRLCIPTTEVIYELKYKKKLLDDLHTFIMGKLSNYRAEFAGQPELLSVYWKALQEVVVRRVSTSNPAATSQDIENALYEDLVNFSTNSARNFYGFLVDPIRPLNIDSFGKVVKRLVKEVETEVTDFLPQLSTVLIAPSASKPTTTSYSWFVQEIAQIYRNDVMDVFKNISVLDKEVAQLQHKMHRLDIIFTETEVEKEKLPDLTMLFSPLVTNFILDQELVLGTFVKRALEADTWQPVGDDLPHSSSVIDVFEIFSQMAPFMFSLTIAELTEFFVATMLNSISRALQTYIHSLEDVCSSRELLIPPSGNERLKGKRESQIINIVGKKKETNTSLDPSVINRLSAQKLETLFMRLNNIHYAKVHLDQLKENLKSKARDVDMTLEDNYWDERFVGCRATINKASHNLMRYIATKVVFFHYRNSFIDVLYMPTVRSSPFKMEDFMQKTVDPLLEGIMSNVCGPLTKPLIEWVYRMFLVAIEYVLLYGKSRAYEPKDYELIMKDVISLEEFFLVRDDNGNPQGLSEQVVHNGSHRLKRILTNLFHYSTEALIQQFNTAKDSGEIISKQHILCVLIHRTDNESRNFMKVQRLNPLYKSIKRGNSVLANLEGHFTHEDL